MKRLLYLLLLVSQIAYGQKVTTYGVKALTYGGKVLTYPAISAVLEDGNTVAWYIADNLTTITKDGSNLVSRWNDYLGSGRDLIQATGTNQPLWSANGILFDGVDNIMITANFGPYAQPYMIYMVLKQVTWGNNEYFYDLDKSGNDIITRSFGTTPAIQIYSGTVLGNDVNLIVNVFGITRSLHNGANSSLQVNNNAKTTGNAGNINNGNGVILGGGGAGNYSNIQIKEFILRNVDDTDADETVIYNYLKDKYGL